MSAHLRIVPRGPVSLERAAGFEFGPVEGAALPLRLAFVVDGLREQAGVVLRPDGAVHAPGRSRRR